MDHRIQQLHQPTLLPNVKTPRNEKQKTPVSFKDVLSQEQDIKVSKHASERLSARNIEINDNQWQKISEKIGEAKQKGVTDSLVITNDAALLVSAKNNTVVTAMNRSEAMSKIFTNINGTILIDE
ncbi:TIGR02530 family flagellar biosynthesis protein [Aquibacillus sediminis]|uniref:TIGR02530 family flagellar biosynthesis protein n=1 Tax=Aquibacillus sediminis TaxID=2574734 RepID=UPI001107C70E|nr:TIGR02530 family flagellar biosynthesis protein [Aquibacillus sediminis]